MTELEEALPYLQRLAPPTMEAFTEARVASVAAQDALQTQRARCSRQVAGVLDGVTYWSLFATFLAECYAGIEGVARITTTHPLAHHWTIDNFLTVQLKSDTGNLPVDQLVIPGLRHTRTVVGSVVLTWDHSLAERFDPAFVHLDGRREVWRRPVASLLPPVAAPIHPAARKAKVSSTRPAVEKDEAAPPS